MSARLAAALLLLAPVCAVAQDAWYTLSVGGERTGYAHIVREHEGDGTVVDATVTQFMRDIAHTGRFQRHTRLRSDAAGAPISYEYAYDAGVERTTWRGTFDGAALTVRAADGKPRTLALPDDTVFDPDPSVYFAPLWKKQRDALQLTVFDPQRQSAGLLRASRLPDDADGVHVRASAGGSSAETEDFWFDAQGRIVRIELPNAGAKLTWTPCRRDCDARVDKPADPIAQLVVRSPVRIPGWFKHRTLRFVISRADGAAPHLPTTGEQSVVAAGNRAVLTICAQCGAPEHPEPAELESYRRANAWVRSDAPEIRTLALNTVARGAGVDFRMQKLVRLVKMRMRGNNDFLGYADAVTALRNGSGDCSEFAVLLAAFARAQDIPTRVVSGLAYADRFTGKKDVFGPHMWVQAWNGTMWKSYDAALDGFDSTHIVLAVGGGEPDVVDRTMAQLPVLRIEKAGVVRDR